MSKKLLPVMFTGTGSDVGKSVINAAFCRIFRQDGYNPAPFKAQNMSLNSYATPEGLEIGRAQAVQAEACGIDCHTDMNPVLLKPVNNISCQVIVNGKPVGNQTAAEYFQQTDRQWLFDEAYIAFERLEKKFNPVVLEGSGSISEINLRDRDITNMRMASRTGSAVILIADIDRGGVFGSLYGTMQLLPENERHLVKGIIINKFRGDITLFDDGRKILEDLTGVPVLGVIPWFNDIFIDNEDSVSVSSKRHSSGDAGMNIAVVLLPHMSNFTDFNFLEKQQGVHLYYAAVPDDLKNADIVILPGSKSTVSDMLYLRNSGMAKSVLKAHSEGKGLYGICGGFQMMGKEIHDPHHIESGINCVPGLGILPVVTDISDVKKTEQQSYRFLNQTEVSIGYEIHMGETASEYESPLLTLTDGSMDGFFLNDKTWGTYMHGIFDNVSIINEVLRSNGYDIKAEGKNFQDYKNEQYDKLAEHVRKNINIELFYKILGIKE
ncbi:MAG: cobyric acid synthase [Spirochaetes bacterium]|nr:cobyric acid synthase [Spirochaetota bacterium]